MHYIKKAPPPPATNNDLRAEETVLRILAEIKAGGEEAVRRYARELDGWEGDICVPPESFAQAEKQLSEQTKSDLRFARDHIVQFAEFQRKSLHSFEVELYPGLIAGQRLIPCNTAGCYVPGGRYAHVASALMSIATARTAGVRRVVAVTPSTAAHGIHPAILYAMQISGVDQVLALGGVQGVAALAYGLFTGHPADVIVGPGNAYVATAKRLLFGQVGIDVIAGPTESAVIADASADPELIAVDLISQAEHGPTSPVWLISLSQRVAEAVSSRVPELIDTLPEPARTAATAAWRDYGEIVYVESREEACAVSDRYAPEHLQVMADDLDWWLEHLTNYGSLFLGEETTVTYGDKCSGPNHILPTSGAARYSGGLSVGKFIKTVTYQRLDRSASRDVGVVAARISRLEGMEGHARSGDVRLSKFFPQEQFDLGHLDSGTS